MKRLFFFLVILFLGVAVSAQKKVTEHKIPEARGLGIGGETLTPGQVEQKAVNDAKIKALKQAGIEENISSYSDFFRAETDDRMEELFTSDILSQINGTVKDVEVLDSKKEFTQEGQTKIEVTIKCTVVAYKTKNDMTFDAWIDGIKPVYKAGDGLAFQIKPTQNCYVRAFMFTDESYVLLPNDWEKSKQLEAHKSYEFPDPNLIKSYEMIIEDKARERELNRLVVVLLKKDIYYTGQVRYKEITDWIMSIPPDERHIESFSFEIYREK